MFYFLAVQQVQVSRKGTPRNASRFRLSGATSEMIPGGLGVLEGVGAIILTAGAAAPLVVTVAVCGAGGCSAAF